MNAKEVRRLIWNKFRIKPHDTVPFTGWLRSSRAHIVEIFAEAGYKEGAEIGVCKGEFSEFMLNTVPGLKMHSIDPWCAYNRVESQKSEDRYQETVQRLDGLNANIIRMKSMEVVDNFEDNSLDFVYIDGPHEFDPVMMDLIKWEPKVRPGGIVAGHDYYSFYQAGVIPAVNAYTKAHNINEWYVTKDREPSFFWVKG